MQRKIWVGILAGLFLLMTASPSKAQTAEELADVLKSGFFGGLIGTMIGGGILLLMDNPDDHLEVLGYGAGSGIILGTIYGIVQIPRNSFAEINEGELSLNIPTVEIRPIGGRSQSAFPGGKPSPHGLKTSGVELSLLKISF
ncbi:MAG TPA: hypothetical protein VGB26_14515 [Nitrospiria bacterium]|jgi:hypothetical protein